MGSLCLSHSSGSHLRCANIHDHPLQTSQKAHGPSTCTLYNNTGNANASDVVLTLSLTNCELISSDIAPTGELEWALGDVAPGTHSFDVIVEVTSASSSNTLPFLLTCDYVDAAGDSQQATDDLTIAFESSSPDLPFIDLLSLIVLVVLIAVGLVLVRKDD